MVNVQTTEQSESDNFVIHMTRARGKTAKVTSIELQNTDMRNRYTFNEARRIEDVFSEELSTEIERTLSSHSSGERVISLPDLSIELPDLLLSGLRILRTPIEGDDEVLMLRFNNYIGPVRTAFKFDTSFAVSSATVRERIAVEVLRDILTPLVDMINLNKPEYQTVIENHAQVLQKRLDHIATRQDELNFYSGLLQRYVAGCRHDQNEEVHASVN